MSAKTQDAMTRTVRVVAVICGIGAVAAGLLQFRQQAKIANDAAQNAQLELESLRQENAKLDASQAELSRTIKQTKADLNQARANWRIFKSERDLATAEARLHEEFLKLAKAMAEANERAKEIEKKALEANEARSRGLLPAMGEDGLPSIPIPLAPHGEPNLSLSKTRRRD